MSRRIRRDVDADMLQMLAKADFRSQSAGPSLLCGRFHRNLILKCLFARNDHPSTKFCDTSAGAESICSRYFPSRAFDVASQPANS